MLTVNTKAAIKRLPIGTRLYLVNTLVGPTRRLQEVAKVQSNAVAFTVLDGPKAGKLSWLYLDGEGQTVEATEKGFRVMEEGHLAAEYEFPEASA